MAIKAGAGSAEEGGLVRVIKRVEAFAFGRSVPILLVFLLVTVVTAWFAIQLKMDAGFEKQMPIGHEYIATYKKYESDVLGANRLNIVVKAREGEIWTIDGLSHLYRVTQAVMNLPNVSRLGVQSLWTPNTFVNEITEEGFRAEPIIPGTVTIENLTAEKVREIQATASAGGFIGTLVARDQTSAMIVAEINEYDKDGNKIDYVEYNGYLENEIRKRFEDKSFEIQIIGFAKQVGEIAEGAKSVVIFCAMALLLTALAVYWYCHSLKLTILPIVCSLTSLVWQFGALKILGYGLDPLAVLIPFLVFAIGVSHGVQQINFIVREVAAGKSANDAAKSSFSGLLVPGALALIVAFVTFLTLVLIPIPMVKELAVAACIGVVFKIATNLFMLPILAARLELSEAYAVEALGKRNKRANWLKFLAKVADIRVAFITLTITAAIFATAVINSADRVVGSVEPGAPELRSDARFNKDAIAISTSYDNGLDWISVIFESPSEVSCERPDIGRFQDQFVDFIKGAPGVLSVSSFSELVRSYNEGYNEGNPKMNAIPLDSANYATLAAEIGRLRGYVRKDCSMSAVHVFLKDHKAVTINGVVDRVKEFSANNRLDGVSIMLASGNAGVLAAINEEIERSETPMLLYVYLCIATLVLIVYRDFRAVLACCLPLTVGTFIGYWFMKEWDIGLTVATLPVMVLAVGIGVDYAFYIYNRLQLHLANGEPIAKAIEKSMLEVGMATVFTALTLALGVATWSFSDLKFQADMGILLSFMFFVNLVMSMTALPALAVVLERLFPRKRKPFAPGFFDH